MSEPIQFTDQKIITQLTEHNHSQGIGFKSFSLYVFSLVQQASKESSSMRRDMIHVPRRYYKKSKQSSHQPPATHRFPRSIKINRKKGHTGGSGDHGKSHKLFV